MDLSQYCLMLGDDALVLAHRLSEWGVRAPELEEAVALGTITVDLLRQARTLLSRAGELEGVGRDEDRLAYFRDPGEFRNVRLAEIDCGPGQGGDFATTVARLLVFSSWRVAVFERLITTRDPVVSALARRSLDDEARHRDHAAQWAIRLGDSASLPRIVAGLERVWPMTGELFQPDPVETALAKQNCAVDPSAVRDDVATRLDEDLSVAGLRGREVRFPEFSGPGGRAGAHTGEMDFLVADMRTIARESA